MQLIGQSAAVSITAVRRANRVVLLIACLPLLIAVAVAAAGRICVRLSHASLDDQRVGAMTRRQAVERANGLCAHIYGSPADEVAAFGYENGGQPGEFPRHNEWQVLCRTATGRCFLRIDADNGEPLVIRREAGTSTGGASMANGDNRGGISPREAAVWVRHYLRLAGLPMPHGAPMLHYSGYDLTYRLAASNGAARMLRVRVNPKDGSLVHLQNVIFRKFSPASTLASP
jgi:hypothetical protein